MAIQDGNGGVILRVDADTSDVEKSLLEISKLLEQGDTKTAQLANNFIKAGNAVDTQRAKVEALRSSLDQLEEAARLQEAYEKTTSAIEQEVHALDELDAKAREVFESGKAAYNQGDIATAQEMANQYEILAGKADELGEALRRDDAHAEELRIALENVGGAPTQASIDTVNAKLEQAENKLSTLSNQADIAGAKLTQSTTQAAQGASQLADGISIADSKMGKFVTRIERLAKRVFVFSVITMAFRGLRSMISGAFTENEQFRHSLDMLQASLWVLVEPIRQAVLPALNSLINGLTKAILYIATFIGALQGKNIRDLIRSAKATYENAQALNNTAGAANKSAKSTKKAAQNLKKLAEEAKDANRQLAAFDDIITLSGKDLDDVSAGANVDLGIDSVGAAFDDLENAFDEDTWGELEKFGNWVSEHKDEIETFLTMAAWAIGAIAIANLASKIATLVTNLGNLPTKISTATTAIGDFLKSDAFKKISGGIMITTGLIIAINNIRAILSGEYENATWQSAINTAISGALTGAGIALIAGLSASGIGIAVGIGALLALAITDIIVNWENLKTIWANTIEAVKAFLSGNENDLGEAIGNIFIAYFTEDSWGAKLSTAIVDGIVGENAVANMLNLLNAAIDSGVLGEVINLAIAQTFKKIHEEWYPHWIDFVDFILGPIHDTEFGKKIIGGMVENFEQRQKEYDDRIKELGEKIVGKVQEGSEEKQRNFANAWEKLAGSVTKTLGDEEPKVKEKGKTAIMTLKEGAEEKEPEYERTVKRIAKITTDEFTNNEADVKNAGKNLVSNLSSGIDEEKATFDDKISGLTSDTETAFSESWENIKSTFTEDIDWVKTDVFDPIEKSTRTFFNTLITIIETFANTGIDAVNSIISALNTIKVSVPDWVEGAAGGKKFSVNLSKQAHIQLDRVPLAAQGGIVPHATALIAGEAGREAILPLESHKEWMDELADRIAARSGQSTVILEVDGREFGRAVVEQGNKENRRVGTRLVLA